MVDLKRCLDVALAATGLFATAPLLGMLAIAIKLDSPGPVVFLHTRVGRGGRAIRVAKLRTMSIHADTLGPAVTAARDPRITRVGRLLRSTKLDELPQLWNVLRGEMSLVGPRPEVRHYVERYEPRWQRLLTVRPGLTDVASLAFRDEERLLSDARDRERAYLEIVLPLKLELALYGIDHASVIDDLLVIGRTAAALLRRDLEEGPVVAEARRRIQALNEASES